MNHSFNIKVAQEVGIEAAIVLNNIAHWVSYKKAADVDCRNGYYWVYMSADGFAKYFPYMSIRSIRYALNKLETEGLIASDILQFLNKNSFDRTKSYTLTEKAEKLLELDLKRESEERLDLEEQKRLTEILRSIQVTKAY